MCNKDKEPDPYIWYFHLCEKHKQEHRAKIKKERESKKCEFGNHIWKAAFHGGIEKKRCLRCDKVRIPSYMNTALEIMTNSFLLYGKMEKLVKRFPRKYRRFEEHNYSERVVNILYWLRYEKKWTAERIEETFNIEKSVTNLLIARYPWKKGDKYLIEKSMVPPVSIE